MSSSLALDTPIQYVKGVGPKRAELLKRVGVETIEDILNYFPRRYIDRSRIVNIQSLRVGEEVTVVGKVLSTELRRGRKDRLMVMIGDRTGIMECIWFQGIGYMAKVFRVGDMVAFSGRVTFYRGPQLIHPEYDKISEEGESDPLHTGGIIPMYPSTEFLARVGLDSRGFRKLLKMVINGVKDTIEETLSVSIIERQRLISISDAYKNIHFPSDWKSYSLAEHRLKFEELFYIQLFLALQRKTTETARRGISCPKIGKKIETFLKMLPFELTDAQKRVMKTIRNEMGLEKSMNRLLQGDVGCGKTVVALYAMIIAVENGYQAALMAPTEILAEQHFLTIRQWLKGLGINVTLLKGSQKGRVKEEVYEKISGGDVSIVVGTHALIQERVRFKKLGLVVIDEQHRFGVIQRAALGRKGYSPNILVMTATPIPRTLALTLYGDLDVSVIDEMPEGRMNVDTFWRKEKSREKIYQYIKERIKEGNQAYIVYPLVEESEKIDLAAATEGFKKLSEDVFKEFRVALLHGRMNSEEKEAVMNDFKSGSIDILVSTTVIEVGIDVPNATVMLIEHAERFGLTQLHQLRGRVGRGGKKSTCILLSKDYISEEAEKRLRTMISTTDGFKIAEADLQIRGPGELFGTRQHGELNLKIANLAVDGPLLEKAREEAFGLVKSDPELQHPENRTIRNVYARRYRDKFGLINVA